MIPKTVLEVTTCIVALFLVGGCESSPSRGSDLGRGDKYSTTAADVQSQSVSSVTLIEFADTVAEALAVQIPSAPEIAQKNYRVLIELGDIVNNTSTPTRDFSTIRRRIFLSMVKNQQITNTAQINERSQRVRQISERYRQPEQPDLLDEGTGSSQGSGPKYRLEDIYVLNGTVGEIRRGSDSLYIFDMTLTNLDSGEIVFAELFEAKQVR